MTLTSASPPDADAGAARTLILRLRREPGSDCWRGHAICVQTGATMTINLVLDGDDVAQLAEMLHRLLSMSPDARLTLTS